MMKDRTIITQPMSDDVGNLVNIDGECYIKTSTNAGGINHVLMTDQNTVMTRPAQLTSCSREVPGDDVIAPEQVSTDNVESVTGAPCEYNDYRCMDILNESCHYGLCDCNFGVTSTLNLKHPIIGLTYFSITWQTTTPGFKHMSIKADDTWYDVLTGDTSAPDLLETHWIDFSSGRRYHGINQADHDYPDEIPDINFWKLARIQGFRFKLVNDTRVSLPLFRIYNTLLRQGDQRVPMLSKPIRIQYSEI